MIAASSGARGRSCKRDTPCHYPFPRLLIRLRVLRSAGSLPSARRRSSSPSSSSRAPRTSPLATGPTAVPFPRSRPALALTPDTSARAPASLGGRPALAPPRDARAQPVERRAESDGQGDLWGDYSAVGRGSAGVYCAPEVSLQLRPPVVWQSSASKSHSQSLAPPFTCTRPLPRPHCRMAVPLEHTTFQSLCRDPRRRTPPALARPTKLLATARELLRLRVGAGLRFVPSSAARKRGRAARAPAIHPRCMCAVRSHGQWFQGAWGVALPWGASTRLPGPCASAAASCLGLAGRCVGAALSRKIGCTAVFPSCDTAQLGVPLGSVIV